MALSLVQLKTREARPERSGGLPVYDYGVREKPSGCAKCPMNLGWRDKFGEHKGHGFCPDYFPREPKVAFWLEAPGQEEIIHCEPLVGKSGKFWVWKLINSAGRKKTDCLIVNTLRCNYRFRGQNAYPTGDTRWVAEACCRQYDSTHGEAGRLTPGGVKDWGFNRVFITLHPALLLRTPQLTRLVQQDVRKAFVAADAGHKPLVLMGDKAMSYWLPFLVGGVKRWRGHWFDATYNDLVTNRGAKRVEFSWNEDENNGDKETTVGQQSSGTEKDHAR